MSTLSLTLDILASTNWHCILLFDWMEPGNSLQSNYGSKINYWQAINKAILRKSQISTSKLACDWLTN